MNDDLSEINKASIYHDAYWYIFISARLYMENHQLTHLNKKYGEMEK